MSVGVKRVVDIVGSALMLAALLPVIVIIGVCVGLNLGWPIVFRQKRPGLRGVPFTLIKFRTMRGSSEVGSESGPDEVRLTAFGRWLRSTSLDELPELVNVLLGEMSLVGPRPLLAEYLPLYNAEQARRHEVRPGITGWAQVNGRNALDWPTRLALDVWYVDHQSFWLDLKILWLTFWKVVRREGISQPGQATMERFRGNA